MEARDDDTVVISDPRAIRALAHPARMAVLERLFEGEVLTATECARLAGLTPSAMSYHLRALERWGLVARAEATADGRERPWRALGSGLQIRGNGAGAVTAEGLLLDRMVDDLRSEITSALAQRRAAPADARPKMAFTRGMAMLTEQDMDALNAEVEALLERYGRRGEHDKQPSSSAGARRHHLWWAALPARAELPES